MFVPTPFKISESDALAIAQEHEFACLVDLSDEPGRATHLPLTLGQSKAGKAQFFGHFAKGNPQAKTVASRAQVVAIFSGPHGYVSPNWYDNPQNNVGTWDYMAVHITGRLTPLSDEDGMAFMRGFSEGYEQEWSLDALPADRKARLFAGIVPFILNIQSIQGVAKLSQNHPDHERRTIAHNFAALGNQALATKMNQSLAAMQEQNPIAIGEPSHD